jgi:SAM-dependent methyltransferase
MHEILRNLQAGALALDLGCDEGSFPPEATPATVVRVDREAPKNRTDGARFVQSDAGKLPFSRGAFAAVISNHSLEHFEDLAGALREIARVIDANGSLFVSVPDSSTLTDKVYRWVGKGGGHINAFTSPVEVAAAVEGATGLRLVATRVLCSSLSFLNRRNVSGWPRRLLLLGGGYEWSLFVYAWLSRRLDRWLDTRTSIYGWAFYFGHIVESIDTQTWVNVCIRCGSGCSASFLMSQGLIRLKFASLRVYRCPACGATNPFADDPS